MNKMDKIVRILNEVSKIVNVEKMDSDQLEDCVDRIINMGENDVEFIINLPVHVQAVFRG